MTIHHDDDENDDYDDDDDDNDGDDDDYGGDFLKNSIWQFWSVSNLYENFFALKKLAAA